MSGLLPNDVMSNKMTLREAMAIDLISNDDSRLPNIFLIKMNRQEIKQVYNVIFV
jgi:hypothetical protein